MEEKPVMDMLPYPRLHVFDSTKCLQYFSKETILADYLGSTVTEHQFESLLFSQVHLLVNEPEALFLLMSVCPEEEIVNACRRCWQLNKTFTVSVVQIIQVFLNWGATLETLGIEDDLKLLSSCKPLLNPTTMPDLPAPCNIKAVLDALSDRLTNEEDENAVKQKNILVHLLVTASLDERFCQHKFKVQTTICEILETLKVWTLEQVAELVRPLEKMLLQNAAHVCCSLFVTSHRVRDLKIIAVRSLLHTRFYFLPPLEPLQALLENLPSLENVLESFNLLEIYVLIQLLNTLLITYSHRPKNQLDTCLFTDIISMGSVERLLKWTEAVHSKLVVSTTVEGGLVREKCVRLRADCKELIKNL